MKIPDGPNGHPTVSATQLRRYGAGGFRLTQQEEARGCPRQWKAHYIDHVVQEGFSYPLLYGQTFHQVMYLMEEEAIGPEEALDRCFPPQLEPSAYRELLDDLTAYIERGASPMDRFGTLAVETELTALLYVDEEFGPIYYRGFIDWIGVDLNVPNLIHVVDYKTNRTPPSVDDVRGDVQLKGYDWLVRENIEQFAPTGNGAKIIQHLDAVKWREIEVGFDDRDIEDWHGWAIAVVRTILRDETAEPELNPGCAWCPVKDDCPVFLGLPELGKDLLDGRPPSGSDDVERLAWRDTANAMRLLLEKAVKSVDDEFKTRALATGPVTIGGEEFVVEPEWRDEFDLPVLHRALGDAFYRVVTLGKGKLAEEIKDWPPSRLHEIDPGIRRVPIGSKVVRRKVAD